MSYSTPGILTDESRWLAKMARQQKMMIHQLMTGELLESVTFTIGDGGLLTPLNGTNTYINTDVLSPATKVFLNGTGYLSNPANYTVLPNGGIQLTASNFTTGQTYIIIY